MNHRNNSQEEELQQIKDGFLQLQYLKELLYSDKHKIIISQHVNAIKLKIVVAENRLLELVPDNLLNELGF